MCGFARRCDQQLRVSMDKVAARQRHAQLAECQTLSIKAGHGEPIAGHPGWVVARPDRKCLGRELFGGPGPKRGAFSIRLPCAFGAPPRMKIRVSGQPRGYGSACATSSRGCDCLEVGSSVWRPIPSIRLTRARKGTTICRTRKREGRMTVSAPDLRRSNRLRMEASWKL